MLDVDAGLGPLYMETDEAIQKIADEYKDDPKAFKKKMKELESEAWEDFLDMTISQAILWAALNVKPEEKHSEIAACEPYFIGSHSGASGAWVSGPEDLDTPYKWGYANMTTVDGLFAAGDASGASSHKFSSGSHAEGRIAGKAAIKYIVEKGQEPNVDAAQVEELKTKILHLWISMRRTKVRPRILSKHQLHHAQAVPASSSEDHGRVCGRRDGCLQDQ